MTTRQIISTGTAANDGTGDTLRSAGQKINANFESIYTRLGGSNNFSTQISIADSSVNFTVSGNTLGLSAPGLSGARNIRLPDASGVITLNTATQTLTNKSITMSNMVLKNTDVSGAGSISNTTNPYIRADGTGYTATLANADAGDIGKVKVFTYTGSGTLNVTVTSGANFSLTTDQSKMCVWTGSKWILLT